MKKITYFLLLMCMTFAPNLSHATLATAQQNATIPTQMLTDASGKTAQKLTFWQKAKAGFELKKHLKSKPDFSDGTKKWLYLAGIFAIASIVIGLFVSSLISSLLWSAAGVCLVIWLLKYLDVI